MDSVKAGKPVARSHVERALGALGVSAPDDYLDFISSHDGAEVVWGSSYALLFSLDDIAVANKDAWEDTPWLVHVGSDGAGTSYAFDTRTTPSPLVAVDMMDHKLCTTVGYTLADLLAYVETEAEQLLSPELIGLWPTSTGPAHSPQPPSGR